MTKVWRRWMTVWLAVAMVLMAAPSGAESPPSLIEKGDDVIVPIGEAAQGLPLQATDPLGLLVGIDTVRDHSLGRDILEVWSCGVPESAQQLAAELEAEIGSYFAFYSRGRYEPVFRARGSGGSGDCQAHSEANAGGDANGAILITPSAGGQATPGWTCGYVPCDFSELYAEGNFRFGYIGNQQAFYSTAAHEMGHMIQWPHSFTGQMADPFWREYDNALDLMSGNWGLYGQGSYGSDPEPYAPAVINLYAAGWIDPQEVYVFSGDGATFDLASPDGVGHKMAIIRAGDRFYTLGSRIPSSYDPIPEHWSGVEVYEVTVCQSELQCLSDSSMQPGFRRVKPHPPEPFRFEDRSAYDEPLAHVIREGETRSVAGVNVTVSEVSEQSIQVSIGPHPQPIPDPPPPASFTDTTGHIFAGDVEWLAAAGITKGCNPPANSEFCPDDAVTRGQMAAFLHRALPALPAGSTTDFTDDNASVFESDIEWLAASGVTRGCNPPVNDRFCPDDVVTRGQMAAFLHRALPGLAAGSTTDFTDDNASVFESDIEWLAATGVTRGCNPPANDRFCPDDSVTRGAMAAFLHRAIGG